MLCRRGPTYPDVVILDLGCRTWTARKWPATSALVAAHLVPSAGTAGQGGAPDAGADDYVTKLFGMENCWPGCAHWSAGHGSPMTRWCVGHGASPSTWPPEGQAVDGQAVRLTQTEWGRWPSSSGARGSWSPATPAGGLGTGV